MNILIINGRDLSKYVAMSGYEVERADLSSEESGRMLNGREHKDIVARIDKLYVKFVPSSAADSRVISTTIESAIDLRIVYMSPFQGLCSGIFHCGNRKTKPIRYKGNDADWDGITVNFVEADPDQHKILEG